MKQKLFGRPFFLFSLLEIREILYELLTQLIPADLVLEVCCCTARVLQIRPSAKGNLAAAKFLSFLNSRVLILDFPKPIVIFFTCVQHIQAESKRFLPISLFLDFAFA